MGVAELMLVRHGESLGNVAATAADQSGAPRIDIGLRDADVELSPTGAEQAHALGLGLAGLAADRLPDSVWCSPYRRAVDTAQIALRTAGLSLKPRIDERLRDRDLGILDLLTLNGIQSRLPDEAERRQWLGKFYYRPPGGEAWTDLALRIRSLLTDLDRMEPDRRVLVVCHDVVVLMFRYVCEQLTEQGVLEIGRTTPVRNTSMTSLRRIDGSDNWTLDTFNDVGHLDLVDVETTAHSGDPDVQG